MVYDRRGKNTKKRGHLRSMRCKSADSGVSCTLNKKVLQQDVVQSSKQNHNVNGLEEEHLDFEPDFIDDLRDDGRQSELLINSDQSTVKLCSDSFEDVENDSVSTISIAHRRDMLPVPPSDAEDGRESEYLQCLYSNKVLLDSSSDNTSSSSNSLVYSTTDNFESSAQDAEDSESILSMTQEEEDKLLDTSEDEYAVEIDRKVVQTCQIGNARITFPKFVNNNVYKGKSKFNNALKRTTTSAHLNATQTSTKKQKWDLRYRPDISSARLFLDDLGYIPCTSEDGSESSGSSVPQLRNFRVICNENDKIVCVEPSKTDGKSSSNFKMPLPPPKRPPTRPKRTVSNSEEYGRNLQIKVSNKVPGSLSSEEFGRNLQIQVSNKVAGSPAFECADKDDTLSIIASTIGVDHREDIPESEPDVNPFELDEQSREQVQPFPGFNYTNERVKAWIERVEYPRVQENTPAQPISNPPINVQPPVSPTGNQRIPFNQVPVLLCGVCFHYYFNNSCVRPNYCTHSHTIPKEKFTARFQKSNAVELIQAFQFTLNYEKVFKEIYPCFIKAFGTLKLQNELVASIKHFLNSKSINVTEALDLVIKSLESSGLSFLDTIERISFNVGFLEHPQLADILLELISRKSNIAENWEVIKRIAKARGYVAPQIVKCILLRVTNDYPINKELCLDIYNVVVKNDMTDLSQISEDVLAPIRTMAGFGDQHGGTEQPFAAPTWVAPPAAAANPRELLAAHIEGNLVKERERFERQVEGVTLRTAVHAIPSNPAGDSYMRGAYDFSGQTTPTAYNSLPHSMDADERYFSPTQRMGSSVGDGASTSSLFNVAVAPPFSTSRSTGSSGGGGRASCSSPSGSVPFEVTEYVPQTIRRNESPISQEQLVFEPPPDLMEPAQEPTLTPLRPIFGRPNYRKDFDFEKSLHNLLPNFEENVNIDEKDILVTNNILKNQNGPEYYRLLNYYKGPTIGSFITMTIAHLKSINTGLYDTLNGLLTSLGRVKPDYAKDVHVKAVFEVVAMNLLFIMERKGNWGEARRLLEWFCDWDSLVSSHLFQIFTQRRVTHMGRYLFLAKIFANARNFHFTYEILQCPDLHLLEPCDIWPHFHNVQVDLASRDRVLNEFFTKGFHHNIVDVSAMYRRIYRYSEIYGYDTYVHFNPMLIWIINEQQPSLLRYFYPDIDVYYKIMHKDVLRAFTIMMADYITQGELMKLYEMCCERQIYTRYNGWEVDITVRNNMLDVELQMILNYYFYQISQTDRGPCGKVNIHIKLMERQVAYPKILQKCVRSMKEINEKIKAILRELFGITIVDTANSKDAIIEISVEQIETWRNRRWLQQFYGNS